MRDYEVVYIFHASLDGEAIEEKLESYHERLTSGGAEITALEHWGKRELAYPIQKRKNGYYVVVQFRAEPALLDEFERALELDDELLRHLIVLSEGELPTPPSARRTEHDEDEDDDEDEDEDEDLDDEDDDADDEDLDEDDDSDDEDLDDDADDEDEDRPASGDEGDGDEEGDDEDDGGAAAEEDESGNEEAGEEAAPGDDDEDEEKEG